MANKPRRPPRGMSIVLADGTELQMNIRPSDPGATVNVSVVAEIAPRFFDSCPICRGPATHDEHVPPKAMGGHIMTRTCEGCNLGLSRIEAEMIAWHRNVLMRPRFTSEGVPGKRASSPIVFGRGQQDELILVVDGEVDPGVMEMLRGGEAKLSGFRPSPRRYRLALLKHAYLAACLEFGIPEGDWIDSIRRDLIAARATGNKIEAGRSVIADGLIVLRYLGPRMEMGPVMRSVAVMDGEAIPGVLLAGRVFVSWISDIAPDQPHVDEDLEVRLALRLGTMVEGQTTSVDHE